MAHRKVSCLQCPEYKKCSIRTRLFVNYCGSDRRGVEDLIKEATAECRARGGHLIKKHFLSRFQADGLSVGPTMA